MKHRLMAVALAISVSMGCASFFKNLDEYNSSGDDDAMSRCRKLGRASVEAGASPEQAYENYYNCTVDAGLR